MPAKRRANWEDLKPPPSVDKILAFAASFNRGESHSDPSGGAPGRVGLAAAGLSGAIARRISTRHKSEATVEEGPYRVRSDEVSEFTKWLFRVKEQAEEDAQVRIVVREVPVEVLVPAPAQPQADLDKLVSEAVEQRLREIEAEPRKPKRRPSEPEPEPVKPGAKEDSSLSTLTRGMLGGTNRFLWTSALGLGSASLGMAFARHESEMLGWPGFGGFGGVGGHTGLVPPNIAWRVAGATSGTPGFGAAPGMGWAASHRGLAAPLADVVSATSPAQVAPSGYGLPVNLLPAQLAVARYAMASTQGLPVEGVDAAVGPQHGQITLFAPSVTIASEQLESAGSGVEMDWHALSAGSAPLDAAGLRQIQMLMPEGVQAIYPALPPGALGSDGVNLPLAPSLARQLIGLGYGVDDLGAATMASSMAIAQRGGSPAAQALPAAWVPIARPLQTPGQLLDSDSLDAPIDFAGAGASSHDTPLDFLGLPVRLAPTLGADASVRDIQDARASGARSPGPYVVKPEAFWPLLSGPFDSFTSVEAEPGLRQWEQAAPEFGLSDVTPGSLLAPGYSGPDAFFAGHGAGSALDMRFHASGASPETSGWGAGGAPIGSAETDGWPASTPIGPSAIAPAVGGSLGGPSASPVTASSTPATAPGGSTTFEGKPAATGSRTSQPVRTRRWPGLQEAAWIAPIVLRNVPGIASAALSSGISGSPMGRASAFSGFGQGKVGPTIIQAAQSFAAPGDPARPEVEGAAETTPRARTSAAAPMSTVSSVAVPQPSGFDPTGLSMPMTAGGQEPAEAESRLRPFEPALARRKPTPPMGVEQAQVPSGWFTNPARPDMPLRPRTPVQGPMAVQAAHEGEVSPARAAERSPHRDSARANETGNATQEINVLANEVWTILKRRIVVDSQRAGIR